MESKKQNDNTLADGRIVLCGANAYEKKYFFNKDFERVPESIQEQLHIVCVLFTEEVGGIITFVFDEDGTLQIETTAAEEDILYDEIGSGMLVRQIQNNRREMLNSLELFYKVFILHQNPGDLLEED